MVWPSLPCTSVLRKTCKTSDFHGDEDSSCGLLGSDVVGYQCFGQPCCLHLQDEVKMEVAWPSEM
jgi:hypothetical protein